MNRDAMKIREDLEDLIRTAEAMKSANADNAERIRDSKQEQLASLQQQLEKTKKMLSSETPPVQKTNWQRCKEYFLF